MPDVSGPADKRPRLPPTAGLDGLKYRTAAEAALEPGSPAAHDLVLVVDVLPDKDNAAVFNTAGALPFSIAPGIAPAILAVGSGSGSGSGGYGVLCGVAGVCAIIGEPSPSCL